MSIPPGFSGSDGNKVCRLKKALWVKAVPTYLVWKVFQGYDS